MPKVSGGWDTFGPSDVYSTGFANLIQGGLHIVADPTERDAITGNRRGVGESSPKRGIAVLVVSLNQIHYKPPSQSDGDLALNNNWVILSLAGVALSFVTTLTATSVNTLTNAGRSSGDFYICDSSMALGTLVSNAHASMTEVDGLTLYEKDWVIYSADGKFYHISQQSFTGNIAISQVTNLQTTLDGKVNVADVLGSIPTTGDDGKLANIAAIRAYLGTVSIGNVEVVDDLYQRDALTPSEGTFANVVDARPYWALSASPPATGIERNGAQEITHIHTINPATGLTAGILKGLDYLGVNNQELINISSEVPTGLPSYNRVELAGAIPTNGATYNNDGYIINDDVVLFSQSFVYNGTTWLEVKVPIVENPDIAANSAARHTQGEDTTTKSIVDETGLKALPTNGVFVLNRQASYRNNTDGKLYMYQLVAGTDAENSPDIIRPNDYSGSNQKVWKLGKVGATDINKINGATNLSDYTVSGNTTFDLTAVEKASITLHVTMNQAFDGDLTFTNGVAGVRYIIYLTTNTTAYIPSISLSPLTKVRSGSALIAPNNNSWVHRYHVEYDGLYYWVTPEYDQN